MRSRTSGSFCGAVAPQESDPRNPSELPPSLHVKLLIEFNGIDPAEIAFHLADHFALVGSRLDQRAKPESPGITSYNSAVIGVGWRDRTPFGTPARNGFVFVKKTYPCTNRCFPDGFPQPIQ